MNRLKRVLCLLLVMPLALYAQDVELLQRLQSSETRLNNNYNPNIDPTLKFRNVWVPPTADEQVTTAAYMTISSPIATSIEAIYCPIAERVEFQEPKSDPTSALERMKTIPYPISLYAGTKLVLEPKGQRMVFVNLKQPLRIGEKVSCTFQLRSALYNNTTSAAITVEIPVRLPPAATQKPQQSQPRIQPTPLGTRRTGG